MVRGLSHARLSLMLTLHCLNYSHFSTETPIRFRINFYPSFFFLLIHFPAWVSRSNEWLPLLTMLNPPLYSLPLAKHPGPQAITRPWVIGDVCLLEGPGSLVTLGMWNKGGQLSSSAFNFPRVLHPQAQVHPFYSLTEQSSKYLLNR